MATVQALREWFWNERVWLPGNATWDDFENPPPGQYYPLERHILFPSFFLGIFLLGIRFVYERCLVVPFAKYMGLTFKKTYRVERNPTLEAVYVTDKYPEQELVQELSKKTSLPERQIQRWFRHRRSQDIPGRMKKFRECSWHFLFYLSSFVIGMYVLWDKPYFWDSKHCWISSGRQHVPNDVYWYYTIELGFYWNLVFTLVTDHKRKDFRELVVHHFVTMMLIYFSFAANQVRIGTLVLLVHDAVDFWLAGAKMANYVKKPTLTDILFGVFFVVWIITRMYIYPFRVVWSATFISLEHIEIWPAYWILNILLWVLQVLHIIWTYMICRIMATKFTGDKKLKDLSSDTEVSTGGEEDDIIKGKKGVANGSPAMSRNPKAADSRKKRRA
ncbi:ceramide synthase 2-like isoform X2 [Pecten maximus]|uniref:ceramide synthase 2-like isoform X2 n=1 Tax=Pecten maximus TaxID=6579 RepID=UPI00145815C2|nr:ceramide synthase 2-like isoform X2 [Pecten maximus]